MLNCNILVCEFELQLCYYVQFFGQIPLGKLWTSLSPLLWFWSYHYSLTRVILALNNWWLLTCLQQNDFCFKNFMKVLTVTNIVILSSQHNNEERRVKTSLEKYCTSHFIVRVRKGYSRFACERELETEQKLQYFDPTLMAVSIMSFLFSWCSTGGPDAYSAGWWLSLLHLISIFSGPQFNRGPRAPLAWCGFPYHSLL